MYFSKMFLPTMREVPAEAESISHKLMLRAGLIRKQASGIYSFLPLGLRALKKIENIIRREMERIGAQELLMPTLLPAESFVESGRWETFGLEMFRLKDRSDRDLGLGPAYEEIFAETVKNSVRSYRSLPLILYQIQTKYRDEIRPRNGILGSREFMMIDACSFDRDKKGLDGSYNQIEQAYRRIFDRLRLDYMVVEAYFCAKESIEAHKFMVISEIGEDEIVYCKACGYAAGAENARCPKPEEHEKTEELPIEKIFTPNIHTISELSGFLDCQPSKMAKTLIFRADNELVAAMVRGDRELNEAKLKNILGCRELEIADAESVRTATNAEVGFAGPIGLKIRIIADHEVAQGRNLIVGANETDHHLINVNFGRDFDAEIHDIRKIAEGDVCPCCGKTIAFAKGIEAGHMCKLKTKFSEPLKCNYIDESGSERPMVMGCYGIGINRLMAAVIEQNNDEKGIIWPIEIAPYHVIIVPVNVLDETVMNIARNMYEKLIEANVEVILDDRNERAGVKFNDADLIGIPIRINIGRKAAEGLVELKLRNSNEVVTMPVDEALEKILSCVKNNIKKD